MHIVVKILPMALFPYMLIATIIVENIKSKMAYLKRFSFNCSAFISILIPKYTVRTIEITCKRKSCPANKYKTTLPEKNAIGSICVILFLCMDSTTFPDRILEKSRPMLYRYKSLFAEPLHVIQDKPNQPRQCILQLLLKLSQLLAIPLMPKLKLQQ